MQAIKSTSELVIVSNRLPVHRVRRSRIASWKTSPGGLVSALKPVLQELSCTWVGWAGVNDEVILPFEHDGIFNWPVYLSASEVRDYYEGFSNRIIWPLFHDAIRPPEYCQEWWKPYVEVNRRFAEAAAEAVEHSGMVWVHDYQLMLVPAMVRQLRPDVRIGFFLHIPFPPQELYAQLPWRRQIAEGLLGADVLGFQTKIGAENFSQVARRFAGASGQDDLLDYHGRSIRVDSFPISVDTRQFEQLAQSPEVTRKAHEIRQRLGPARKIMLGIDRLDYTKGIDIRLKALQQLLRRGLARCESCVFVQIAVPSREHVAEYKDLRLTVERLVGEINGEFGDIGRTPVQYLHRSVPMRQLAALYRAADVMLVTPLRDGMNLVAKEYVASRVDNTGVLVLSEFTGAARELRSALLVNPHDLEGLVEAMHQALNMPQHEQELRMRPMRRHIQEHDVHHWADSFLQSLVYERT